MIESSIIDLLAGMTLASSLTTYNGRPSIFSGMGPEDVDFPYLVVYVRTETPPDDSIIDRFKVTIDVFDWSTSEKIAKDIAFKIINGLDNTRFNHDRYSDIRLRKDIYFKINVPDPRGIQLRVEFTGRGTRSEWIKSI